LRGNQAGELNRLTLADGQQPQPRHEKTAEASLVRSHKRMDLRAIPVPASAEANASSLQSFSEMGHQQQASTTPFANRTP